MTSLISREAYGKLMQDIQKTIGDADKSSKEKAASIIRTTINNYNSTLQDRISYELQMAKSEAAAGILSQAERHKTMAEIYQSIAAEMSQEQKENNIIPNRDDIVSSIKKAKDKTSIKGRILLVDDEADIVAVYKAGLSRDGFNVVGFSDPEEALSLFKPDIYDLVILDIGMPKINGFELCREIRKRDGKVKIYFMTTFEIHKTEFEKVLPSIKVDGFITKPVSIADLCPFVQSVMTNGKGRDVV